jgi:hypothetical protein
MLSHGALTSFTQVGDFFVAVALEQKECGFFLHLGGAPGLHLGVNGTAQPFQQVFGPFPPEIAFGLPWVRRW